MSADQFPSHWQLLPLSEAVDALIDYRGKTPRKTNHGVPLVTAKIVKGGTILPATEYIAEEDYDSWMVRGLPKAGDVVVTTEAPLGEVAQLANENVALAQRIVTLRGAEGLLQNDYLRYVMQGAYIQGQLESRATGSTVKGIKQSELRKIILPIPPEHEQIKIAGHLRALDDKIQLNHQINQTLEQMAQAIFKSWFVDFDPVKAKIAALEAGGSAEDALLGAMQAISGKGEAELTRLQAEQPEQYAELRATAELFPAAMQDSELGEIPEGWEPAPLSELFELHRGFDLPQKSREEGPYEVYAAGGLHGTHSQYKMEPPGIITGRSGVIGNVYLSLKKYWPLNTTLYVRQFRSCGPYYAYHLLKTLDLKTLNSGSAVPSLNRNFVHSISVINPGSTVLNKFESLSSSLFEQVVQNIDQNELLSTLRDTLLPKLLSGELSVSTAEDQLAEAVEPANV